jgi:hypothetical protein
MRTSLLHIHIHTMIRCWTITRPRAQQLNLEVRSFLSNSLYDLENRLIPNDYIVLKNEGEV